MRVREDCALGSSGQDVPNQRKPLQTLITDNQYTYDEVGNRKTNCITRCNSLGDSYSRTEFYNYDSLYRLTDVVYSYSGNPLYDQHYDFDSLGNRTLSTSFGTSTQYGYNNANMLERVNSQTQNYFNDANGNQTSGGGRVNKWDSQNRLRVCDFSDGTSHCVTSFTYGPDGLRRQMVVTKYAVSDILHVVPLSIETTDYVLEGQNVVQEIVKNGSGQKIRQVDYVLDSRVVGRTTKDYTPGQSEPDSEQTRWMLFDGLGTVLAEAGEPQPGRDQNGDIILQNGKPKYYDVANYDDGTTSYTVDRVLSLAPALDVYGNVLPAQYQTSQPADTADVGKHRFVGSLGHTTEPDMGGLIYMRARWYDPVAGRFVSEDPAGDGVNWYAYCYNNPVNLVDADGNKADSVLGSLIAMAGGLFAADIASVLVVGYGWRTGNAYAVAAGLLIGAVGAIATYKTLKAIVEKIANDYKDRMQKEDTTMYDTTRLGKTSGHWGIALAASFAEQCYYGLGLL